MKKLSNVVDVQGLTTTKKSILSNGFDNKYFIVKEVVDHYDIAGLLARGCPNDEYDIESKMISDAISEEDTIEVIATVIQDVFERWLGMCDDYDTLCQMSMLIKNAMATLNANNEDYIILDDDSDVDVIADDFSNTWGIKREGNGRYVIIDTATGEVLDDIQGYGCESYDKARNYGYCKYHTDGKCSGVPNIDNYNTLF